MAGFYPIIQGFTTGILTRRMWGRTLSEIYANALETCKNWVISPQGSIRKRPGTQFVAELDGTTCVLKTFNRDVGDDLIACFMDSTIRLVSSTGIEVDTVELVKNGSFTSGIANWAKGGAVPVSPAPTVSVVDTTQVIANDVYGFAYQLQLISSGGVLPPTWSRMSQTIPIANMAASHKFSCYIRVNVPAAIGPYFTVSVRLGTTPNAHDILDQQYPLTPGVNIPYTRIEHTFVPGVANVYFFIEIVTIALPNSVVKPVVLINNVSLLGDSAAGGVSLAHPYTIGEAREIQVAMDSAKRELYVVHGNHYPRKLYFDTVTATWKFDAMVFYEVTVGVGTPYTPPKWATGSYPKRVALHQSRLWFANTVQAPSGLWATKVGNYGVLKVGSNAADPLAFELTSPVAITWIQSHKVLIIGTDNSEFILTAAGGTVTPADFQFSQQSFQGSVPIQPPEVNIGLVYVAHDARRVRFMRDGGDAVYGWISQDISLKVSHDVGSHIVGAAYCLEPNYLLYLLLNDGNLITCTFAPEMELISWSSYETDTPVISITPTQDINSNYLFMAKARNTGKIAIEKTNPPIVNEIGLDSYSALNSNTDTLTTIGANVALFRDGAFTGADMQFNGAVRAIINDGAGNVVIGGDFTKINNETFNRIARFSFTTGRFEKFGTGCNDTVRTIAVSPVTGATYIGGDFTTANGVTVNRVAAWDGLTFVPLQTGLNNSVHTLAINPTNGNLFAGGIFTQANTGAIVVNRTAFWNGTVWAALGTGANQVVRTMIHDGTFLYAGGEFTTVGGVAANFLARHDGATWLNFAGTGASSTVRAFFFYLGDLYVGGDFASVNGVASSCIIKWNGTVFSAMGAGVTGGVYAIDVDQTGSIFIGGAISAPAPLNKIARFDGVNWISVDNSLVGGTIYTMMLVSSTNFVVGGDFTSISGYSQRLVYGLDHLDGYTVEGIAIFSQLYTDFSSLSANGFVKTITGFDTRSEAVNNQYFRSIPPTFVIAGAIPIESWVEDTVVAGLPFESRLKTVPLEGGNQAGTSQGGRNRWPKIFARIVNSCMPEINGYVPTVPADQVPPWGAEEDAIITGDFDISSEGFDRASAVEIVSQSNLRTEIAGIFGKATSNNV